MLVEDLAGELLGWGWGEHGNVIKKERFGLRDAAWQKDELEKLFLHLFFAFTDA